MTHEEAEMMRSLITERDAALARAEAAESEAARLRDDLAKAKHDVAFAQSVRGLLRLIALPDPDGDEADALRDELDSPWYVMIEADRKLTAQISAYHNVAQDQRARADAAEAERDRLRAEMQRWRSQVDVTEDDVADAEVSSEQCEAWLRAQGCTSSERCEWYTCNGTCKIMEGSSDRCIAEACNNAALHFGKVPHDVLAEMATMQVESELVRWAVCCAIARDGYATPSSVAQLANVESERLSATIKKMLADELLTAVRINHEIMWFRVNQ